MKRRRFLGGLIAAFAAPAAVAAARPDVPTTIVHDGWLWEQVPALDYDVEVLSPTIVSDQAAAIREIRETLIALGVWEDGR